MAVRRGIHGAVDALRQKNVTEINQPISNIFVELVSGGRKFGSWIDEDSRNNGYDEDDVITNPAYVIESILRDELGLTSNDIDYASFDTAGNTTDGLLDGWKFCGTINQVVNSRELLNNLLVQCKCQLYRDPDGKFSLIVYDSGASIDYSNYQFDKNNNITNLQISQTDHESITSEIRINYALDRGSGEFRKTAFVQSKKKFSGTYLNEAIDGTESAWDVDDGTKFSANDLIMTDREINEVSSIAANTLTLTNVAGTRTVFRNSKLTTHADNTPIYIIEESSDDGDGSTADTTREGECSEALWKYDAKNKIEIDADWIIDTTTAVALRDHYHDYYNVPHWVVEFDTFLRASDLRIGHIFEFDDSIMDTFLKVGGNSWSGKQFRCQSIGRLGAMDYHIVGVEL